MRQILIGLGRVHLTQSGISLGEPDHIISCGRGCWGTSICARGFHYAPDNGDTCVNLLHLGGSWTSDSQC